MDHFRDGCIGILETIRNRKTVLDGSVANLMALADRFSLKLYPFNYVPISYSL